MATNLEAVVVQVAVAHQVKAVVPILVALELLDKETLAVMVLNLMMVQAAVVVLEVLAQTTQAIMQVPQV
jgi:hypothetical protein